MKRKERERGRDTEEEKEGDEGEKDTSRRWGIKIGLLGIIRKEGEKIGGRERRRLKKRIRDESRRVEVTWSEYR